MFVVRTTCNVLPGSAWHTWQLAGAAWRENHPEADQAAVDAAAREFAVATDLSALSHTPRARAFREGAAVRGTEPYS